MALKKSERLLELLQILRARRRPVTGQVLAEELGINLRTLYRDVEALRAMGADVRGEAGIGYQLDDGFFMPPMTLTEEEIEALVLGLRMVIYGPDADMGKTAQRVRAKIQTVLPKHLSDLMDAVGLFAIPGQAYGQDSKALSIVRAGMREERGVDLAYVDGKGAATDRVVWPVSVGYMGNRQILAAWCTLRQDYRSFWIDRIKTANLTDEAFGRPRRTLAHEWRKHAGLNELT